jgi:hypothetical protein
VFQPGAGDLENPSMRQDIKYVWATCYYKRMEKKTQAMASTTIDQPPKFEHRNVFFYGMVLAPLED